MRKAILLGGGIDSTVLLVDQARRGHELHALWVDYGQKAAAGERAAVTHFCTKYGVPLTQMVIPLFVLVSSSILRGEAPNPVGGRQFEDVASTDCMEFRNGVLISLGLMFAAGRACDELLLGFHREPRGRDGDWVYPDASPPFARAMNEAAQSGMRGLAPVAVSTPFVDLERWEILRLGMDQDPDVPGRAFTCYEGRELQACGSCAHCVQLAANLERAACAASSPASA